MPDAGRVVVAGASGLIGSELVRSLAADGVAVTRLVRRAATAPDEVSWDPTTTRLDPAVLEGARAVVCLNGATLGRVPWTKRYRHEILWSRVQPTQAVAAAVRALGDDAPAFVSGSAVGFYASAPGIPQDEAAPRGESFLSDVCGEWEAAAAHAGPKARVALLRTAPVVHADGVLKPLLTLTRLGLGGRIGRGTQAWPWISLDDEVRAIRHVMDADVAGPVNLTGPVRATANDLGFALAMRMNRPFVVPAPAWALRLALGADMADSLLLSDMHVLPRVLLDTGFAFRHATVEEAVAAAVPAGD
ncbi:TIGR01777 family oxidoreductase [Microbacterium sp. No. 7]|uniref:TIGR01777 family oxidoreductase n=1 Tax=Microbacterium sp. No. 7 TaxID=1714373 RepID=UPI0006D208FD|nr:TIGR01777 family oxidoreductase [Microbacterium sp. No. 7]ALJ21058.1 nucleoside-diphosphate sugar epimerase [Microbacterium sp. No. 7]